ncbi:MAG: zinc-binding dehydrogenase [Inquilinus sp.]|nr:zinc-binding dehydrogenase [Inquilinus sp.]
MSDLPTTMRGVWLTGHGDLDKLEMRNDIPVPRSGPRDVLIHVAAAGVNNTDINTRTAWYSKQDGADEDASWAGAPIHFPRIQGADVCGRIVAVGEEIDPDRIGERVLVEPCIREANGQELERPWYFGSECDGGFAEYTVVASRHAHRIESALSDTELASFPCSYSTAENLLTRSNVGPGDRVLVTGASGGVGSAAIQLAKARGARVIAVTSPAKSAALRRLGAERTLAREDNVVETLGRDSIDVVVDLVAGPQWPELLDVLRPGGRYAVAGAIGGPMVELDVRTLYLKDLSLFGCTVLQPEVFANLVDHIERGRISPIVAETFALERIADAQTAFLSKKHIGKIVLTLGTTDGGPQPPVRSA